MSEQKFKVGEIVRLVHSEHCMLVEHSYPALLTPNGVDVLWLDKNYQLQRATLSAELLEKVEQ